MQQQLMVAVKGAYSALKKIPQQGSNQGKRRKKVPIPAARDPNGKATAETMMWPEKINSGQGG